MPAKAKRKKESASRQRERSGAQAGSGVSGVLGVSSCRGATRGAQSAQCQALAALELGPRLPRLHEAVLPSGAAERSGAERSGAERRARKKGAQRRYSATLGQLLLALPPLLLPVLAQVACAQPNRDISHQPATPVSPGLGLA